MTIVIELPDAVVAAVIRRAQAEGRTASDLMVEVIVQHFGGDDDEAQTPSSGGTVRPVA